MLKDNPVIAWLIEDDNPAVAYRTRTEILGEKADKTPVIEWIIGVLPDDWQDIKGLWSIYWLTAIAESGLSFQDIPMESTRVASFYEENHFDCACGDFMRLRAMVRLGFDVPSDIPAIMRKRQLPDGGFLCLHRLDKLKYIPKSCVKANMHALLFCAECRKRGFQIDITDGLLYYFWKHHLFYRTDNPDALILNAREGWRTIDTFYPFEVMRIGLQNFVEAFCALGYGDDEHLNKAWEFLEERKSEDGKYLLNGTLSKSYLPKERWGKPSKWVTFYTLLAWKERDNNAKCNENQTNNVRKGNT